jgi:hypothetical protein
LFGALSRRLLSGGGQGRGGSGGGVGSDFHINKKQIAKDLNEQVLRSEQETLCDIIKTRAADILEESDLKNMKSSEPQSIANSLHSMATKQYRP